ncbi:MAG: poly-gamma-glutamate hydrolase family protein [Candidatus Micrarchaeia archaeon]|jgi:phage replication-related protein YjqB (UPF0714/DUF867 family)
MPSLTFRELLAKPNVHEFSFKGRGPGILAVHGGAIEEGTERITRKLIELGGFAGYIISVRAPGATYRDYHVPSTFISPGDSETLLSVVRSVDALVAIHGQKKDGNIYVGGLNEKLRIQIAYELGLVFPGIVFSDLATLPPTLRGASKTNIVNFHSSGGVQIELPLNIRVKDIDFDLPVIDESGLKICAAILRGIGQP